METSLSIQVYHAGFVPFSLLHRVPSAAGFIEVADEDCGEEVVNGADDFEESVTGNGNERAVEQLMLVFDRRCRRVGQDEEGEIQDRVQIG